MDTSNEYIEMCQKAEEIQKLRIEGEHLIQEDGDFFWRPISDKWFVSLLNVSHRMNKKNDVWLPRLDQLISIVGNDKFFELTYTGWRDQKEIDPIMKTFYWDINTVDWKKEFNTPEKMWLCFVMLDKFKKVWQEKEFRWISIFDSDVELSFNITYENVQKVLEPDENEFGVKDLSRINKSQAPVDLKFGPEQGLPSFIPNGEPNTSELLSILYDEFEKMLTSITEEIEPYLNDDVKKWWRNGFDGELNNNLESTELHPCYIQCVIPKDDEVDNKGLLWLSTFINHSSKKGLIHTGSLVLPFKINLMNDKILYGYIPLTNLPNSILVKYNDKIFDSKKNKNEKI